jgi:hypothetical protein
MSLYILHVYGKYYDSFLVLQVMSSLYITTPTVLTDLFTATITTMVTTGTIRIIDIIIIEVMVI